MLCTLLLSAALAAPTPPVTDDPGSARPIRHWDVTDGHLRVTLDPATAEVLQGHVTWQLDPAGLPHDRIRLHAVALDISEVRVDGEPVTPTIGRAHLDIPAAAGTPHTVDIHWTATPERGLHGRPRTRQRGPVVWTQGENSEHRHWYPGWDHPSDTFTLTTSVTVPDGLHAVANGTLQDQVPAEDREGFTTWTYRLDQPIVNYLVALVAGDLAVDTFDGPVPHEILRPADVTQASARVGAFDSPAMMTFFAGLLDEPYPYPVYRQAYVPRFMYGGMENASLTILTTRNLSDGDTLDRWSNDGLIAHELAHQWFGDLLTCHGWRELWLNEGFATYYAGRWAEHADGEEAYAAKALGWLGSAVTTNGPMASRSWADGGGWTGIYPRGAFVLHMLRTHLGTDVYDAAIARYVEEHRFSLVETADLRQVFEDAAAQDLRWFFDRWVHGWGSTELTSRWAHADGQLTVTVQQAGDDPYEGPIQVWWGDGSGSARSATLHLTGGASKVVVPAETVTWVLPDPDGRVIADWTRHQPTAAWIATLQQAPGAMGRLLAVTALGEVETDQDAAAEALAEVLAGGHRPAAPHDPSRDRMPMAQMAADALGALGTDPARDALIAALPSTGLDVLRERIVSALGDYALDDVAEKALLAHWRKEEVLGIQAGILRALAAIRPSTGLRQARMYGARPDRELRGMVHAAVGDVFAEHGGTQDLLVLQGMVSDDRRVVQHNAANAMVEIALRADDDAVSARVAKAVAPLLTHSDIRTRSWGAVLLGQLASPAALPALQAIARTTTDDSLRRTVRNAIRASRRHDPETTSDDALLEALEELEALKERLEDLEERVGTVEAR